MVFSIRVSSVKIRGQHKMPAFKPHSRAMPAPLSRTVAAILRDLRKQAALTLAELAERSGVSRQMLGYVELLERKLTLDLLARICGGREISPARLITRARRLGLAPLACQKCRYSCRERGRLVWLNRCRGCLRPAD
jgi:transcriptional regulator with XRE-family HTH domain